MIYNSAGHNVNDPGAVGTYEGKKIKEADIMMEMRNLITKSLAKKGVTCIEDKDSESLGQYLARIKPGTGSVIHEGHLNSFTSSKATGIEVIIPTNASKSEREIAGIIAAGLHKITGLPLRNGGTGVITETESARGSLAIMKKPGINLITEYGFISNQSDMTAFFQNKYKIADFMADCLILADTWFS